MKVQLISSDVSQILSPGVEFPPGEQGLKQATISSTINVKINKSTGPFTACARSEDTLENIRLNTLTWASVPHSHKIDKSFTQKNPFPIKLFYCLDHDHNGMHESLKKQGHAHPCEFVDNGKLCGELFYHRHTIKAADDSREYPQACSGHVPYFNFDSHKYNTVEEGHWKKTSGPSSVPASFSTVAASTTPKPTIKVDKGKHSLSSAGLVEAGLKQIQIEQQDKSNAQYEVQKEKNAANKEEKEEEPKIYKIYPESHLDRFVFRHRPFLGFNSDLVHRQALSYNRSFIGSRMLYSAAFLFLGYCVGKGVLDFLKDVKFVTVPNAIMRPLLTCAKIVPQRLNAVAVGVVEDKLIGTLRPHHVNQGFLFSVAKRLVPFLRGDALGFLPPSFKYVQKHAFNPSYFQNTKSVIPLSTPPLVSCRSLIIPSPINYISRTMLACAFLTASALNLCLSIMTFVVPYVSQREYVKINDVYQEEEDTVDKDGNFEEMRADRNTYVKLRHVDPCYAEYEIRDSLFPDPQLPTYIAVIVGYHAGQLFKWVINNTCPKYHSDVTIEHVSIELARHVASDIRTDGKEEIIPTRFFESANRAQNTIAIDRDFALTTNVIDNTARFLASRNFSIIDNSTLNLNSVAVTLPPRAWPLVSLVKDIFFHLRGILVTKTRPWMTTNVLGFVTVTASVIAVSVSTYESIGLLRFFAPTVQLRPVINSCLYMASTPTAQLEQLAPIATRAMSLLSSALSHTVGLPLLLLWTGLHSRVFRLPLIVSALLLLNPYVRTKSWIWTNSFFRWISPNLLRIVPSRRTVIGKLTMNLYNNQ